MKAVTKICPSCNNEFQAERKNKTYCSDTCRAEVNNEKLREKIKSLKNLETKSSLGDKYRAAYQSAIRIVTISYDSEKDGNSVEFEKREFKHYDNKAPSLSKLGIWLNQESAKYGSTQRTAIYIPQEGLLCFNKSSYSSDTHTFKMV